MRCNETECAGVARILKSLRGNVHFQLTFSADQRVYSIHQWHIGARPVSSHPESPATTMTVVKHIQ